jgi:hypothetical protein
MVPTRVGSGKVTCQKQFDLALPRHTEAGSHEKRFPSIAPAAAYPSAVPDAVTSARVPAARAPEWPPDNQTAIAAARIRTTATPNCENRSLMIIP